MKKSVLIISAAMILSACEQEHAMSALYKCENGTTMTVEFKDGKQVTISNENGSITLPRVEAAAGVKYELEGVIFWSRGIDAAYTAPGMASTMCRR